MRPLIRSPRLYIMHRQMSGKAPSTRVIKAVHGLISPSPDPDFEIGLAAHLRGHYEYSQLVDLYERFTGDGDFDALMMGGVGFRVSGTAGHAVSSPVIPAAASTR